MKIPLRKGTTIISVEADDWFSNNLYCSTSLELDENNKILELDFSSVFKSRIKNNSTDDLEYLNENINEIRKVEFFDKLITGKLLRKGLKTNELILVKFISEIKLEKKMKIKFINVDSFYIER